MKRALLSLKENNRICDVVVAGEEFEVTVDFVWIDCPDDVTTTHTYNPENNTFKPFDPLEVPGFAEEGYRVARGIAYGSVGDQLDMMFKELQSTGTVSDTGPWAQHIASVKSAIPKDDPEAVMAWNRQYAEKMAQGLASPPPTGQNITEISTVPPAV